MSLSLEKLQELGEKTADLASIALPLDPETTLHVDGDYAAYYFAGNDETTFSQAKAKFLDGVRIAQQVGGAGQVVIHITGRGSDKGGRFKIATVKDYQGQRDSSRRPKNWDALRAWLEESKTLPGTEFRVVTWMDREADDGVAAAARYAWEKGKVPVIFSRDKDFRMIPGRHVTWTTLERIEFVPERWKLDTGEVDTNGPIVYGRISFWLQMLQGDAADNIPGLEKSPAKKAGTFKACGSGCAHDYLDGTTNAEQAYRIVSSLYKAYYGGSWPDRFVEQAALLWLRVDNDAYVGDFMRAMPAGAAADLEKAVLKLEGRIR